MTTGTDYAALRAEADAMGQAVMARPNAEHITAPFTLKHKDFEVETLERLLPNPVRIREHAVFTDAESLQGYARRFLTTDEARARVLLIAHLTSHCVKVIFDHHAPGLPVGNRDHTAALVLDCSRAWTAWDYASGKYIDQSAFAEFLDQRLPEIVQPAGGDILDSIRSLRSNRSSEVVSQIGLPNGGTRLEFAQTASVRSTGKSADLPESLVLGIPVFEDTPPVRVTARLRYRVPDKNAVTLAVMLERHDEVYRAVFRQVAEGIGKALELPCLFGKV